MFTFGFIASVFGIIFPMDTVISNSSNIFSKWHVVTMDFEQQTIPGCFLDFGTDVSWIASKDLCQMNQCSFNSLGYSPNESTRGTSEKIAFGGVSGAYYADNWKVLDRKVNIPFIVAKNANINWSCRLSLGLNSQILWKLKYEKILDSNTITFQAIGV